MADLIGLSEPATKLIEKVSDAVGGIARPWQIKRVASAEADAEIIKAQARVKISEIEERALVRMVREEGQKQENIENITAKAIPHLNHDAKPENIEKDWLTHFFDQSRLISDEEMQNLWSKVLAGEANKQGSFSKKTVNIIASLDKSDAELFTRFCTFVWMAYEAIPMILDIKDNIFRSSDIFFSDLKHEGLRLA